MFQCANLQPTMNFETFSFELTKFQLSRKLEIYLNTDREIIQFVI